MLSQTRLRGRAVRFKASLAEGKLEKSDGQFAGKIRMRERVLGLHTTDLVSEVLDACGQFFGVLDGDSLGGEAETRGGMPGIHCHTIPRHGSNTNTIPRYGSP
jgi:hypothetical protein